MIEQPSADRFLRGYQLLEQVGTGAFAVVWRAHQPSIGRDVAVKQIRRELATQPAFIRRFEAEASLVARVQHPHVVPLLDFWREPDSAMLVMHYLGGGTLERRLDDGALSADETRTMLRQVGSALSAAHERGVIHRDVKSANVLYDEHGYAYLSDFGIALDAALVDGPAAALSNGTPLYAPPEQLRGEPVGPPADVFSLGIVAYECLAGSLPFASSRSGPELFHRQMHEPLPDLHTEHGIDRQLADAVAKATAKDPADRFATVELFLDAIDGAELASKPRPVVDPDATNPYRGLRAFDEADAPAFFGRDRLRAELITSLRSDGPTRRSAILVGASGSGKSSVIRAGLIPALRTGAVDGSDRWFFTTMTPGDDPFGSLAEALNRVARERIDDIEGVLRSGPRGILRAARQVAGEGQIVALFIDQFEELFTTTNSKTADTFLEGLAVAIEDPASPLRLLATLRADFYDRPLSHPTFAPVLKQTAIDVTPLAADELEEAIAEPAALVGAELEGGLLARIVADTVGEPAPLPLLQYALAELFDQRVDNALTNAAYDDLGGLGGALAVRAERLHEDAAPEERVAMRRLFGRLTTEAPGQRDVRTRVPVSDLESDAAAQPVLQRFTSARLLTFDRDPETREPTVEIAHDALIHAWPRLEQWLSEDRATLRQVSEVATLADRWDRGGRADTDVLRGGRLDAARDLAAAEHERLREVDLAFIDASAARADREREVDARRLRRLRSLVAATAVALVVALAAAVIALGLRGRAEESADEARAQRDVAVVAQDEADLQSLISRSAALATEEPTVSVLLALEAHRRSPGPATERVVLDALTRLGPIVATHEPVPLGSLDCDNDGLVSPDGLVQYANVDGRRIEHDIDAQTSRDLGPLIDPCALWLPTHDGARLIQLAEADDNRILVSDGDGSDSVEIPTDDRFRFFIWTDRGPHRVGIASTDNDRSEASLQLHDAKTAETVGPAIGGLVKPGSAFTPDGSTLVISSGTVESPDGGGPLVVVDSETGAERFRRPLPARAQSFAFDDTANQVVMGTAAGLVTMDLATGDIVSTTDLGEVNDIRSVILRPDGTVAVMTSGRLELVDRELGVLQGAGVELRNASSAHPRPDGRILVHTESHRNLVIDLDGGALIEVALPTGRTNVWVEHAGGEVASTEISTGEVDVIDVDTGDRSRYQLRLPDGSPYVPIAASPTADGDLVTFGADGTIGLWRDGSVESLERVPSTPQGVLFTGAGGDGLTGVGIELGGGVQEALLVQTNGEIEVLLRIPDLQGVDTVVPSADGGLHVATSGRILTFDASGREVAAVETDVCCLRFARLDQTSGRVTFGGDRGFFVYDPATGEVVVLDAVSSVSNVALVRDGTQLVVGRRDGTFQLWDVDERRLLGVLHDADANALGTPTYDEATDSVWLSVPGQAIRIPLDPDVWVERACDVVGRDLTEQEWEEYVPGDVEQTPVCR